MDKGKLSSQYSVVTNHAVGEQPQELVATLVTRWLPTFRRNCWFSGLPTAASAHEKVEWMQSFSREKIELWDLKV